MPAKKPHSPKATRARNRAVSLVATEELKATARQYKRELMGKMFGYQAFAALAADACEGKLPGGNNIVGVGFGAKITQGTGVAGQTAVRVYVRIKKPAGDLVKGEAVPPEVNGLPTDVIAVGDVTAYSRPTACGVSIGHYQITAGTLGCLVETNEAPGQPCILSNNHVLANSNQASIGDAILEPGKLDGGNAFPPIAQLGSWVPLQFGGAANQVDSAIAKLFRPSDVTPDIVSIGRVTQPSMPAALYQSVRKRGRTTLHTVGVVMDLSADIQVQYDAQTASFEDQLTINGVGGPFSLGGDSGSLIVDGVLLRPVALLFAGGNGVTFGNPIDLVLSALQIRII